MKRTTDVKQAVKDVVIYIAKDGEVTDKAHSVSTLNLSQLADNMLDTHNKLSNYGSYMLAFANTIGDFSRFTALLKAVELDHKWKSDLCRDEYKDLPDDQKALFTNPPSHWRQYKSVLLNGWENGLNPCKTTSIRHIEKVGDVDKVLKLEVTFTKFQGKLVHDGKVGTIGYRTVKEGYVFNELSNLWVKKVSDNGSSVLYKAVNKVLGGGDETLPAAKDIANVATIMSEIDDDDVYGDFQAELESLIEKYKLITALSNDDDEILDLEQATA